MAAKRRTPGLRKMHSLGCPGKEGGTCRCGAGWEASVWIARDGKKLRRVFPTKAAARSWQADTKRGVDRGTRRAPQATTLREAAEAWLAAAERGGIRNQDGRVYKPATLRGYRQALEDRVLPEIGGRKLSEISATDLQGLVDDWDAEGLAGSTIRNYLKPLAAIFRRARARQGLPTNPTHDLELPALEEKEVEIVDPAVALPMLDVLPGDDRPIWGSAIFAGLRYGELRALRWSAVDFASGKITVCESWDAKEGGIVPKTAGSRRMVPMPAPLRELLLDHRIRRGVPPPEALVFGDNGKPFHAAVIYRRADRAWAAAGYTEKLRLQACRHTFNSMMLATGAQVDVVSRRMGHSSARMTLGRYSHVLPGPEADATSRFEAFLAAQVAEDERLARGADSMQRSDATGEQTGEQNRETA